MNVTAPESVPQARPYRAPWWLRGGQAQTIWPALFSRAAARRFEPHYRRERWTAPDGDFIDVDFATPQPHASATTNTNTGSATAPAAAPLLVLFHGLEGSSRSHYARAFAAWCAAHGWAFAVPHFRGCSGELNLAPRAYHSGDYEEIGWILARMRTQWPGPRVAVGVSLGGNALLRWAEEAGAQAARDVQAVCAVSSPIDLAAGGAAISRGLNRQVYTRMFLRTMKPKALRKLQQHPGLFDEKRLRAARDLYEFDNVFTAPLHGFRSTEDYWARASSKPHLHRIAIPALVINARNDPFLPAAALPAPHEAGAHVLLEQPAHGGHVGFARGGFPGVLDWLPERVMRFFIDTGAPPHG
ncbi:MAG: alpha/beta fold hydrolase [Betaproteobacteria bacterium]|nr:alpha/beta fold hydrolase [Betaproteobacteria bacterium]